MVKVSGGQILISGGSGFIGRYVVELLQDEYDVVVIDQIKPNYKTKFQKKIIISDNDTAYSIYHKMISLFVVNFQIVNQYFVLSDCHVCGQNGKHREAAFFESGGAGRNIPRRHNFGHDTIQINVLILGFNTH